MINFSIELTKYVHCREISIEKKIEKILDDYADGIIREATENIGAQSELERRLLFGLSELFAKEALNDNSKYQYLKSIIHLVELQNKVMDSLDEVVNCENNRLYIGQFFQKSLCADEVSNYIKYYYKK